MIVLLLVGVGLMCWEGCRALRTLALRQQIRGQLHRRRAISFAPALVGAALVIEAAPRLALNLDSRWIPLFTALGFAPLAVLVAVLCIWGVGEDDAALGRNVDMAVRGGTDVKYLPGFELLDLALAEPE